MNYYYLVITIFLSIVSIYIYYKFTSSTPKRPIDPSFYSNVIVPNANNLLIWKQPVNATDATSWNNAPSFKPLGTVVSSPSVNGDNSITFTDPDLSTVILNQLIYYFSSFDIDMQVDVTVSALDGTLPKVYTLGSNFITASANPIMLTADLSGQNIPIDSNKKLTLTIKSTVGSTTPCPADGCYSINTVVGLIIQLK